MLHHLDELLGVLITFRVEDDGHVVVTGYDLVEHVVGDDLDGVVSSGLCHDPLQSGLPRLEGAVVEVRDSVLEDEKTRKLLYTILCRLFLVIQKLIDLKPTNMNNSFIRQNFTNESPHHPT